MSLGFEARLLVVALAGFALVSTMASVPVAALWRWVVSKSRTLPPPTLARGLLVARAMPSTLAAATAALITAAFARFEPGLAREEVGLPMLACAALGAALLVLGLSRSLLLLRASSALGRRFRSAGRMELEGCPLEVKQVQTSFPVVALAGPLRPHLIVASRVAEVCTREELTAIVAHELAHLRARDSLSRALFSICPDLLGLLPAAAGLERAWHEASEQAADEAATGADPRRRLALASALVKVARLAKGCQAPALPASALFRGEPVADRVRRLIAPPPVDGRSARWLRWVAVVSIGVGVALGVFSLFEPTVYDLVEGAIKLGR